MWAHRLGRTPCLWLGLALLLGVLLLRWLDAWKHLSRRCRLGTCCSTSGIVTGLRYHVWILV